jgi:hypothetical protein
LQRPTRDSAYSCALHKKPLEGWSDGLYIELVLRRSKTEVAAKQIIWLDDGPVSKVRLTNTAKRG